MMKPEVIVFAGPNGSGKTTLTRLARVIEPYINADDIKAATHCTDLEAAQMATAMREGLVERGESFTFETVLSTRRNLDLLIKARQKGYFIRCIYVLTADFNINIKRVRMREKGGGHGVAADKIAARYERALGLLPELVEACDILHIYDNTNEAFRIFKKRKNEIFMWENDFWDFAMISKLVGVKR